MINMKYNGDMDNWITLEYFEDSYGMSVMDLPAREVKTHCDFDKCMIYIGGIYATR